MNHTITKHFKDIRLYIILILIITLGYMTNNYDTLFPKDINNFKINSSINSKTDLFYFSIYFLSIMILAGIPNQVTKTEKGFSLKGTTGLSREY